MKRATPLIILSLAAASSFVGCSADEDPPGTPGAAGTSGAGGAGAPPMGGSGTSGSPTGGSGNAGSSMGGSAMGGGGNGGSAMGGGGGNGGSAMGGGGNGGSAMGGSGGTSGSGGAAGGGMGGSAGAGGGDMGGSLSAGCGKMPTIPANMYNNGNPIPIMAANKQRRYILSVPANYDNAKPYNLVIAWHQLDGNDKQMYQQNFYWLKDIAEAASSTIFVAPNGTKNDGTPCTGTGVAEGACGWPDANGAQVALADAVVKEVTESFCIDKKRIFANGWSYGGSMTYRTACSRPINGTSDWGVRGVAVYNGAAQLSSGGCNPSKAVAFYASHGTNDNVLGYDGGVSMATTFAKVNSCTAMTPTKASGNHVCTNYMGCTAGYPVEFCSFVGPHTPDPPREGGQRWQPQEVWKFFSQLPR